MSAFEPTHVCEIELAAQVEDLVTPARGDGGRYAKSRALVRRHGAPIGFATIPLSDGRADVATQLDAVERQLGDAVRADRSASIEPGPFGDPAARMTVVIPTKDPGSSLVTALRTALDQDLPPAEVLLVDNGSETDSAHRIADSLQRPEIRVIDEPIAGLSRARNRGMLEARTDLVAFTDDDVRLDRGWLAGLARGFTRAPRVGCVTGIVATAELDTPAQAFFDARVHWAEQMHPRLYDLGANRLHDRFFPYSAGVYGTGANHALDRRVVAEIGGFDEALGLGTSAPAAEDLDVFLRVILGGWTLAYEPAAVTWHSHRRETEALTYQMYTYGVGLSAYAFKHACHPRTGADMAWRAPGAIRKLFRDARSAERTAGNGTAGVAGTELRALLLGPPAYLRSRWALRRREAGALLPVRR